MHHFTYKASARFMARINKKYKKSLELKSRIDIEDFAKILGEVKYYLKYGFGNDQFYFDSFNCIVYAQTIEDLLLAKMLS